MKKYNVPQIKLMPLSPADIITASDPFANSQMWSQGVDMQAEQI